MPPAARLASLIDGMGDDPLYDLGGKAGVPVDAKRAAYAGFRVVRNLK